MTTKEIAQNLTLLLKAGQFEQAQRQFFAQDVVSVEPTHSGQSPIKGLENVLIKGAQFRASVEQFHSLVVSEPLISNNHFALTINLEATFKQAGKVSMEEIIVYQVKDGKIIYEQFFY
jgi:hypothetical protein